MAAASGEAMTKLRLRLAVFPVVDLKTEPPAKLDRTDHVSPCPQSAGAAMQVGADNLLERVLESTSKHV